MLVAIIILSITVLLMFLISFFSFWSYIEKEAECNLWKELTKDAEDKLVLTRMILQENTEIPTKFSSRSLEKLLYKLREEKLKDE